MYKPRATDNLRRGTACRARPHTFLLSLAILPAVICYAQSTHAQTPPAQSTYPQTPPASPTPAHTKCPWINEATARGILGGPVTLTVTVNDQGAGACDYSRQQAAAVRHLRISVDNMTDIPKQFPAYLAQCPPKSPSLRAIGNEAIFCTIQFSPDKYAEKVVSRVRAQAFVVSVSSTISDDPSMTQEMRREKANQIAEQVAGILF